MRRLVYRFVAIFKEVVIVFYNSKEHAENPTDGCDYISEHDQALMSDGIIDMLVGCGINEFKAFSPTRGLVV